MPRSTERRLQALPGVGRKTANVVLNVAFGEPTFAVDTHVFRVGNRTGLAPGTQRRWKWSWACSKRVPERSPCLHAHHWLILHGRYVCMARRPLCESCSVAARAATTRAPYNAHLGGEPFDVQARGTLPNAVERLVLRHEELKRTPRCCSSSRWRP